ncbi:vanadium-dependent haloperoxidase [Mucilaginibacter sp. OK098]|uniref:vanadium-dependent haloperoxidase n=1 Tax=Mucilaginibacter sp. OK098 TaxID=1855297 RepID=UPI00091F624E|nr:vanadium-dependent haloperoxidase [Mucilaginibacter sp. OK098]SHM99807.1 PAP2 superfamily protein [Mucilaginibacter sp. OK098]
MRYFKILAALTGLLLVASCTRKPKITLVNDADVLHNNMDQLTQVIIYDVFTPPVASRIYGYTSLASYEAMRYADPKYSSIITQLKGFGKPPEPQKGKQYNFTLAATKAFFTVAHKITFSIDTLKKYEDKVYAMYKDNLDDSTYARSVEFGEKIGKLVLKRAMVDNYPQTRGKPKYLGENSPAKWHPTPPDYMDGVEFCWGTIKAFAIDTSAQFSPPPPPPYSEDKNSAFVKQYTDVYNTNKNLTKEQIEIAKFWDDNPFVIQHNGHLMFADKKITPGGHWIGITAIACKKTHANGVKTAQAYALTSIALYDAFICCWEVKYKYSYARPVTNINEKLDHNWLPLLQTPPFPEYTAGHSTISAAAAVTLTHLFGDNFEFQDTSDLHYIGMQRHFKSFSLAAEETAISRYYGGIHYLNSSLMGANQGKQMAEFIWNKLKLTN